MAAAIDELTERLRQYLSTMTSTKLAPDDDFFGLGLINSLRALEIVTYIERTFDLEIGTEDLDLDNFRSAARIAAFVTSKQASTPAEAGG
ncbi:acyl carrier protein [Nocardia sp. XZ_19_369]|uniref:acyl carrier protein n=1 Tax=Nocardia sp. XZ_19_369 TaxID=2769487 RepID=UPI00188EC9B7|nr:acyl carrier protein [Nocardia sp. XZ_19_369]